MGHQRSAVETQVAELLHTARKSLGLSMAFLTRMDGETQTLEIVDTSLPFMVREGHQQEQDKTLCQAILDGRLPPVIPDLTEHPEGMALPAARMPHVRSYASIPVVLSDGTLYGTFCAAGVTAEKGLNERDRALMEVLAQATATLIEPDALVRVRDTAILSRLTPVVAGGGPLVVLQPIVDLATGARSGAEALSRFPVEWGKAPDVCFAEAHLVGLGTELELLALRRAMSLIPQVSGYVGMNASPSTVFDPGFAATMRDLVGSGVAPSRVLLELSEHDPVEDYAALLAALAPWREQGMRLAVDDVGSGYSSLRHIVVTRPEVIKLDRSIVAGAADQPVIAMLVRSLVDFAKSLDAVVVAEGIETATDAEAITALGVDHGQGWHFGRPVPVAEYAAGALATQR